MARKKWAEWLWDAWCFCSLVGIWPRFIEPRLLVTSRLKVAFPLPLARPLRVVQISDLHIGEWPSRRFLDKIAHRVAGLQPDLIVFTGDFLCYGAFKRSEELESWCRALAAFAPGGVYAILGNHDYTPFMLPNEEGGWECYEGEGSTVAKGFRRLLKSIPRPGVSPKLEPNPELIALLKRVGWRVLRNRSLQLSHEGWRFNLAGCGEAMFGDIDLSRLYENLDEDLPTLLLLHNPDGFEQLANFPFDVALCGHTHGGQVNLPWLRDRFIGIADRGLSRGLVMRGGRSIYINRGVGSVMPFRWFAAPEIALIELKPPVEGAATPLPLRVPRLQDQLLEGGLDGALPISREL